MPLSLTKIIPLAAVLLVTTCSNHDRQFADTVLAAVGDQTISAADFKTAYQAGPALLKDVRRPRQSFLQAMINEQLLATMLAKDSSYSQRPAIMKAGRLLEQELLVERLFKTEVHNKVQVSEQAIQDAILHSGRSIRVRYLVSPSRDVAAYCLQQLDAGLAFDSLTEYIPDSLLQAVYLDSTDYLAYGELDAAVNDILF